MAQVEGDKLLGGGGVTQEYQPRRDRLLAAPASASSGLSIAEMGVDSEADS